MLTATCAGACTASPPPTDCRAFPPLSAQIVLPVVLWDERGSSADARASMRGTLTGGRHRTTAWRPTVAPEKRRLTNEAAAAEILNRFLRAAVQW